jgi:hypothetical protein
MVAGGGSFRFWLLYCNERAKRQIGAASELPTNSPKTDELKNLVQSCVAVVHSSRSRIIGSIESARCAGIHVASSPSNNIARTVPAKTIGSRGVA